MSPRQVQISEIQTIAQCQEFQYLLLGDLRDLLDDTPDESTRPWLLSVLEVLLELMPRERDLYENGGGYMSQVLEECPMWDRNVLRLHLHKLSLDRSLRELFNRIQMEASWVAVADQVQSELADWMTLFRRVHRQESRLMVDAMLQDIGTGD